MARQILRMAVATLLVAASLVTVADGAHALEAVSGCEAMNDPVHDGSYARAVVEGSFVAGDQILIANLGAEITLVLVDGEVVFAQAGGPAEVEHVVGVGGAQELEWGSFPFTAEWTVSCVHAGPTLDDLHDLLVEMQLPTPVQRTVATLLSLAERFADGGNHVGACRMLAVAGWIVILHAIAGDDAVKTFIAAVMEVLEELDCPSLLRASP